MSAISILYFESSAGGGGSSASLYRLVRVLNRNGVKPVVVVRETGPNIERIRGLGIKILSLPKYRGRLFALLKETFFLIRVYREERIRIVHLNTGVASGLSALFAAKLLGIPAVSHARGNETMFMGRLSHLASRWVDAYVCVSEAVRKVYGLDTLKEEGDVKTIYDGLDPSEFSVESSVREAERKALGLTSSNCAIGMFARFVEGKGHDQFLLAAREVAGSCDGALFFLVGVNGLEKTPYANRIETMAKPLGRKVKFLGWQSDVKPTLSAMDIVVLPSQGEGLGLALAEAMALGKPVVATEVGGIPELVREGKEGLLVPPSDTQALARAIRELVLDGEKRRKMSESGRKRISDHFSIDRVAGELLETYERLVAKRDLSPLNRAKRRLRCTVRERASGTAWQGISLLGKGAKTRHFSILMYHRVLRTPDRFLPGIREESLRQHLTFLRKHFELRRLSEIVKTLEKGERLSPRTVCITFDDGVRNTYDVAFPILSSMKVPATVFLVTGAMDRQKPIWTDLVARFVSQYEGKKLTLSGNGMRRTFVTGTENEKMAALTLLKRWLKAVPDTERERIVEALSRMVPAPEERSMMTWNEAREMAASGIEFGAHTVSHPILSRVENGVLEKEIRESKQRIEEMTGKPITLFAYPNGEKEDFDARAVSILQANGFSAACTTMVGINRGIKDPFLLKRIPGFEEPLGMLAFRLLGYRG